MKNNEKMSVDLWIQKSTELHQSDKHEEELTCYDKAFKIAKNDVEISDILFNRILALEALGRYEEAIEDCNKLIELNVSDTSFYWASRESFLFELGKYNEAIELKLKEANKFCNISQYDEALSWYNALEFTLQDLKKEYNTDLFQKYAEFYLLRSAVKLHLNDGKGAKEDLKIYDQIMQQA